jgi:hypothetical protein
VTVTPLGQNACVANTDQRSTRNSGSTRPKGTRHEPRTDAFGSPDTVECRTSSPDTAESVTEAIALLESFVSSFEPGRYSGDDAAVLVDRFSRGEHLCATNNNVL